MNMAHFCCKTAFIYCSLLLEGHKATTTLRFLLLVTSFLVFLLSTYVDALFSSMSSSGDQRTCKKRDILSLVVTVSPPLII